MKFLLSILIVLLTFSCKDKETTELDFLVGTWKRENRDQFEVWEKNDLHKLSGYSYRMDGNQKSITETLEIEIINNQYVYKATVPDQNEGRTVQFILNTEVDTLFSFENYQHDFPKKIQYKIINENTLQVIVSGEKSQGFSYVQKKQ